MITPERLPRVRSRRSRIRLWTRRERARIFKRYGRYSFISAIVAALLLPGGFVIVPVIAWWRRRKRVAKRAMREYVTSSGPEPPRSFPAAPPHRKR